MDRTLRQISEAFYFVRIWKREEEHDLYNTGRKSFFMFYYWLFQIFLVTCSVMCESADETIFLAAVVVQLSVVTIKMMCLLWNKDDIYSLILDPITVHSTAAVDKFKNFDKDVKKFMKFIHSYVVMMCSCYVFFVLATLPMFTNERKLPLFIIFTFTGKHSEVIYWIAYVFVLSEILLGYACTLINILIWCAMFNYCLEYRALGNQMKNLGIGKTTTLQLPGGTTFHRDLIRLIKNHRSLSRTIARFQSCFSKLFTAQITTSGVTICVSAYVLANSSTDNVLQIPIFAAILMYSIFEIFIVMYLANDITMTSDTFSYCLFESAWVGQSMVSIKCILVLGEVVRYPQQFMCLKVIPVNLQSFSVIMKGAYNLFNILQNLN